MSRRMIASFIFSGVFSLSVFAHTEREHGPHEHGSGTLQIAFDKTIGKVEFRAAAAGIIGFEHPAKSASDKTTLADTKNNFENKIGEWIVFDPTLKCAFQKQQIDLVPEAEGGEHHHHHDEAKAPPGFKVPPEKHEEHGEHSDFVANYSVSCAKSPLGSLLTVDFSALSLLKDLDVTVLVDDVQRSAEAKGAAVQISLAPNKTEKK